MAGIRLEWAQFGDFDSFDVIRSGTSMANVADVDLPSAIATNLKTMYYVDTAVVLGGVYFYKVRARRDGVAKISSEQVMVVPGVDFDSYVSGLRPITWLKLDEASTSGVIDSGSLKQSCSVNSAYNLSPRGMILRKGHAGAMGFAINTAGVGQIVMAEKTGMANITKASHTWICYHYRTASTGQARLFGDTGDGVNKRVFAGAYQFPNNERHINLSFPLDTIVFTAVVYNTATKTYKTFQNGVWGAGYYVAPPTSTTTGTVLQVPATRNSYNYYGVRGYISDLAFFDKALTDTEIEQIYALGLL